MIPAQRLEPDAYITATEEGVDLSGRAPVAAMTANVSPARNDGLPLVKSTRPQHLAEHNPHPSTSSGSQAFAARFKDRKKAAVITATGWACCTAAAAATAALVINFL